jgi:hypothetical protein
MHGRWLANNTTQAEAILPVDVAARLLPGQPVSTCLGKTITVQAHRMDRVTGAATSVDSTLRVVGLAEGSVAFASVDVVTQLLLWTQDKVIYNEAIRSFETPVAIYTRSGHIRCNIHATEPDTVAPVVAALESMGYRTQHSLAEQEGLKKLASVLGAIVAMFVFGSLANALITLSITTMMNIRMKIHEIGILQAHGVSAGQIINIFGLQGAILGAAAFLMGSVMVFFGEPFLRQRIAETFKLPTENFLSGSIFSPATVWLLALACATAIVFSIAAVIVPAILVCRISPARAMQRGA